MSLRLVYLDQVFVFCFLFSLLFPFWPGFCIPLVHFLVVFGFFLLSIYCFLQIKTNNICLSMEHSSYRSKTQNTSNVKVTDLPKNILFPSS